MFRLEVAEQLRFYVYRLVDPRDGRTFYVGKGTGNRVFSHAAGQIDPSSVGAMSSKLERIREIQSAGLAVEHHIHRHGLDEDTSFHVEAALIDAYSGLTNQVRGHGSDLFGSRRTEELIARYQAPPAEWHHTMLLVSINRTGYQRTSYDAARYAWKLGDSSRRGIEYVLAVRNGLIVDCFEPAEWLPATIDNFPAAEKAMPGRWGFVGTVAPAPVRSIYVGRRLPADCNFSQHGIRYVRQA